MQSEEIGELAKALAVAQGKIKGAIKGKENPFFRSTYADLAAVMEACREALSEQVIAVVQATDFDSPDLVWIETTLMHSSGQWKSGRYLVRPTKDDPQGWGSAITYARRYALAAMVGVVADNEDDDGEAGSGRGEASVKHIERAPPKPKTEAAKQHDTKAKEAAVAFAQRALIELEDMSVREQLTAWLSINQYKADRLKDYEAELADMVVAAINEAKARVK